MKRQDDAGATGTVRVETRAYFIVFSDELSPEDLTARIGLTPSSVMTKAAKRASPPRPVTNAWKLDSGLDRQAPTWDHLEALCALVTPATARISELCGGEPKASLKIVREFFPAVGEARLGFWLGEPWLAILRQTCADLDVDEYDYTSE
jgi:Domain of unknown function (DUF4279)